jgi:hypothetical protein
MGPLQDASNRGGIPVLHEHRWRAVSSRRLSWDWTAITVRLNRETKGEEVMDWVTWGNFCQALVGIIISLLFYKLSKG